MINISTCWKILNKEWKQLLFLRLLPFLPRSASFPSPHPHFTSSPVSLHLLLPSRLFPSSCRVIFLVCHLQDVTPEQRVSLSAEDLWALDFIFSAYLPRRLFSFFFTDAGHLTVWSHFQISVTQTFIYYSFVLFPLTGCHRLREKEICFRHMLICGELPVEADRYLFPRSHRESDGDCFYVFISSTPSDELSRPHMENFCSDMVHKENGKKQDVDDESWWEEIHFQMKLVVVRVHTHTHTQVLLVTGVWTYVCNKSLCWFLRFHLVLLLQLFFTFLEPTLKHWCF